MSQMATGTHRRGFLGTVAAGAGALLVGHWSNADAHGVSLVETAAVGDEWIARIKGKYRQVFDCTSPNGGFGAAFGVNFMDSTREALKVTEKDITPVVVFRHMSMPLTLNDAMWAKYKIGEFLDVKDPKTNAHATRNIFHDNVPLHPGLTYENMIRDHGVVIVACNMALTALSGMLAAKLGVSADQAKRDWTAAVLPGVALAASGVYAVNRAQGAGCTYCYGG